ncbi:protein LNK1-like isoform X2 [Camellia sinensis]|uniref:protein LNK1-like isoform X2 n=1 Tax=Camellia sinensis TaxID=4442 RepID=UPI001035D9BD|nr:protein LNK1-like isoform X2 [Camellia sinensis]
MSELCMYEVLQLEDIVLDEFDQTDDHIVPHPGNEHGIEPAFQGNSCKKARCEVIGISSSANYASQVKGEGGLQPLKNTSETMLEKDLWSDRPEAVFTASHDSDANKVTALESDNTRMSSHCLKRSNMDTINTEFYADDPIIGERCAVVDSNSYNYPLGDISETENDFSLFHNDSEGKESNDLLYYAWPDIGNLEDVDRMFRSCESTFGIGGAGNEDDLCWFSSSHSIEGPQDVLKSEFKFSCPESSPFNNIPEQHEPSKLNNASSSVNNSSMESASISYESGFQASEGVEIDALDNLKFMNGSGTMSKSKEEVKSMLGLYFLFFFLQGVEFNGAVHSNIATVNHSETVNSGMINFQNLQAKHHNQSEGKRKDRRFKNGGLFHQTGNLWFKDTKLPSGNSSRQVFTSSGIQKPKKNVGPGSFGYLQTQIPYVHLDYIHPSDQIPVCSTPSGINSKSNGLISLTPKESCCVSNCSFEAPVITVDGKRGKLQRQQGYHPPYTSNSKHVDLVVQTCDPISVPKQVHHSQNEIENHIEVKGVDIKVPADLDSSNVQESSCMSSGFGEISLEASSFRQLQQVMEQLDMKTKLCIRDSLYRLARNAEQRHHHMNLNDGSVDDGDTSGAFMAEGTKKSNGFMDLETDTNPIDRSIAHLLFHRPSYSSIMPAHDSLSLNSHTMIHGSSTSPLVMAEKLICEETASEEDKKVVDQRQ